MKIALVQQCPIVGDFQGNVDKLLQSFQSAEKEGATLAVCAELAISAYPPRDYLNRPDFIDKQIQALHSLAKQCSLPCLVGFIDRKIVDNQTRLYNAAAFITEGRVQKVIYKTLLPTYDVFDEDRYFTPSTERCLLTIDDTKVGVSICEDIWNHAEHCPERRYAIDPIEELAQLGAEVLINLSASPFSQHKRQIRQELLCAQARKHGLPLVVVNQVGAHDDLIFDGGSMAINAKGDLRMRCLEFRSDLKIIELDSNKEDFIHPPTSENLHPQWNELEETQAALDALVLGLKQYAHTCGFKTALIGLSGGIDSALTASIAAAALQPENVFGVALPSKYSSDHSLKDAEDLAKMLGIHYQVISIEDSVSTIETALQPSFSNQKEDVTEENIQARTRGILLMALSNKFGHLLLNTGNKSEVAVGYCTLYGDMCGGLSVLSDVFKTEVYRMSKEINRRAGKNTIPDSTMTKPPSAELKPGQLDQDSLPSYPVLDSLLAQYLEDHKSAEQLYEEFGKEQVDIIIKMVERAEHKRYQLAPGLKIRSTCFGPGRRMPIACKRTQT